jgi:hypothetical protein
MSDVIILRKLVSKSALCALAFIALVALDK